MIDIEKIKQHPLNLKDRTPRILMCDGTEVPFPPKNGKYFDWTEIVAAIKMEGNSDPLFSLAGRVDGMIMCAEDNAIAYNLPMNSKATVFYSLATRQNGWPILGNCLIMPEEMME